MIKILLLEDDALFGETLVDLLEEEGYVVSHFANGQDALDTIYKSKFDIYLLDINVPLINGTSLLSELRDAKDNTPAIFLTSHTGKDMLERGFISGADDYMVKPLDSDELLLRIAALLRRTKKDEPEIVGKFLHDKRHKSLSYHGEILELSKKEYTLLVLLISNIDKNVPKDLIFDALWSSAGGGSDGAIRVYINRLKQLLPDVTIENIRGIGYKLVP